MPLESTAIMKVGGGLVAVGGVGGAGYYLYQSKLFLGNEDVYLIAKTTGDGTDSLGSLLDEKNNNLYQCKFKSKVTDGKDTYDSKCEIYLINNYSNSTEKTIKTENVISKLETKEKESANVKTTDKYLKIKINSSHIKEIDFFKEKTVEIVKSDDKLGKTDENVFGKLNPLFWTTPNGEKDEINFPIKYVLVKGKNDGTGTDPVKNNSKCFLSDVNTPFDCDIWKYNTGKEPTKKDNKIDDPKLKELTKDTGSNNNLSAIEADKYYVIEFKKDINIDIDTLSKKEFSMTEWDSSGKQKSAGKKIKTFTFENFVIGDLSVAAHMIAK